MDIDDEDSFTKKCYRCEEPVLDNLNIVYNSSNSKLILWNKYQIFVYGDTEFECTEKTFIPEFQIHILIASNNFLLCLDCDGNVHIHSLKFKSSAQKALKITFQSRDQGVTTCIRHKEDHVLSLKYETETYFLCYHKLNSDFQLEKKVILLCNNEHWPLGKHSKEKYLMTSHSINKDNFEHLNTIFKSEEPFQNVSDLVVLTIDKLNVYACLFSPKMSSDEISLHKLYSCPAEICNIEILDTGNLHLLIGLTMGTIIKLPLHDLSKTPDIIHLNTALYKTLALKDSLIYSDGTTMWKAENTFSDLKLTQFFIKNPNDFVKCGDQIICTTFSKLIYKFSMDDQSAYIPSKTNEYCSAEKLFNNSDYLNKLFEEIDKNNEIVKRLEKEQHYITALSLSKRQDVVRKAINSGVTVFESYEEVNTKECTTEHVKEYFEIDTWIFLISISNLNIYNAINSILSNLSDNIKIYITLSTANKILKTTCIKMVEPLKTVSFLIPLKMDNEIEINVNIKIVINIPRALDQKKALTVLYKNDIKVSSEHFIKTNQKSIQSLKNPTDSLQKLIEKVNTNQYGSIFSFTDTSELESELEHTFYVKLPKDFENIFKEDHSKKILTQKSVILQELSTKEFLKSKKSVIFSIGYEQVKVMIHNDGFSNPLIKISSENPKLALNIRKFFANMIYNDYEDYEPGKEFIGYSFYTTAENFQKALKSCIKKSATIEDFLPLVDQFEKNIIGALPL